MSIMQLELPLFTYASEFNITFAANAFGTMDCNSWYTTILNWDTATASALCSDSSNTFNWNNAGGNQGYFKTAVALLTIYFYNFSFNTANAGYYSKFASLTQKTGPEIVTLFQGGAFDTVFTGPNIMGGVYNHFSTSGSSNICNGTAWTACTFGNITNNQWENGEIMFYALDGMDVSLIESSYVLHYNGYSQLTYPPEAWFYGLYSNGSLPIETNIWNAYNAISPTGLYKPKYWADVWLGVKSAGWEQNLIGIDTPSYQRYVALNVGLGGFFTYKTPRQMIEGYRDPYIIAI